MPFREILTYAVILLSLVGIAIGSLPRLRMNRATMAFTGGAALIATGAISPLEAFGAIDMETIILLLSMMILIANLRLSGFFSFAGSFALSLARSPRQLLALVILASGFLAAFFVNDTVCIMLTPLVADIALRARRNPLPYLIGIAVASNVGSCATIIGNPQNMIIGASSGLGFTSFMLRLGPPSLIGLGICWIAIVISDRKEFQAGAFFLPAEPARIHIFPHMLVKNGVVAVLFLIALLAGIPAPVAAMCSAAIVLVTRRVKADRVFREVDFTLLVFFSGLFIVTKAIAGTDAFRLTSAAALPYARQSSPLFAGFVVLASNLVSNVPTVMLLRPLIPGFPSPETAWYILAMASTYAGNLTLLGSVANLIVAEQAARTGIRITFGAYLKVGLPVTLASILVGMAWIAFA